MELTNRIGFDIMKYMVAKKNGKMAFELTNEKDAYALYCLLVALTNNYEWYWGKSDLS